MQGNLTWYLYGAVAAWVAFTMQAFAAYLCLLLYAVRTDGDIGGLLAAPFMIASSAILGAVFVAVLYVPAVFCLEVLPERVGLPIRMLLPVVTVAALTAVVVAVFSLLDGASVHDWFIAWIVFLATLILPATVAIFVVQRQRRS